MVSFSFTNISCPIQKSMYDSKLLADVQLSAGANGKIISAHKAILSAATEYFNRTFGEGVESTVCFHDIDSDTLESVIQFIYYGSIEILSPETAIQLLKWAHFMELPQLLRCSEDFLISNMTYGNCWEVYFIAKLFNNDNLLRRGKVMIAKDFRNISQTENFTLLAKDSLVELISQIQELISEDDIVEGVLSWINFDKIRLIYFKDFLQILQIENIKQDEIFNKLYKCGPGKEERNIMLIELKKRYYSTNMVKSNDISIQLQKLIVYTQIDNFKFCLREYDFTKKSLSKGTEVRNYGNVLGLWDNFILFKNWKKLIIYDIQKKSALPSIFCDDNFYRRASPKIGDKAYLFSRKNLYQLDLLNNSLERTVPPEQLKGYEFDAMCELNGKLTIIAHNINNGVIEMVTYDPLHSLWYLEPTVWDITSSNEIWPGFLIPHQNCLYYFHTNGLHIYNFDEKKWFSKTPEISNTNLKSVISINNQLIVCTIDGFYEYVTDQGILKKFHIFGSETIYEVFGK